MELKELPADSLINNVDSQNEWWVDVGHSNLLKNTRWQMQNDEISFFKCILLYKLLYQEQKHGVTSVSK